MNHSEHARISNEGKKAKENRARFFRVHAKAAQAAPRVPSLVLANDCGVPGGDPEGFKILNSQRKLPSVCFDQSGKMMARFGRKSK